MEVVRPHINRELSKFDSTLARLLIEITFGHGNQQQAWKQFSSDQDRDLHRLLASAMLYCRFILEPQGNKHCLKEYSNGNRQSCQTCGLSLLPSTIS